MFFDKRQIRHFSNFLTVDQISCLLNHACNSKTENATVGKIINGKYTTEYQEWCTADFVIYAEFESLIIDLSKLIENKIKETYLIECIDNPEIHFLKYKSGAFYKSHIDGQYIDGNKARRGTDRDLTAVFYLNDDYKGGEVYFDFFNLKIKPKQNDLLIYPTTLQYRHSVSKVEGNRYAIVFWYTTNPALNIDCVIPDSVLKSL